jgi:hypothetical protein
MMSTIYKLLVFTFVIALSACATTGRESGRQLAGQLILFEDKAPDKKTALTRFLLTDRYVRVDENFNGANEQGSPQFVVYDRRLRIFYFIDRVERLVKEVKIDTRRDTPNRPKWQVVSEPSQAVIRSTEAASPKATYYQLTLDGGLCYHLVALGPSDSDAYYALREYRIAWGRYLANFAADQAALQDTCYRAVFADDPETILSYGFPTREWSEKGQQRFLVDFRQNLLFSAELFDTKIR